MKKGSERYFLEDKPLFGFDIGHNTIRVMQLDPDYKTPRLKGYGSIMFDPAAIVDGVIIKPDVLAKATYHLFTKDLIGDISTKRVALSLPANHAFTRATRLPKVAPSDLAEAVQTEAEQYIPGHAENLYLDYTILREDQDGIDVFIVAMSKTIIDSYLTLMRMLGLEPVLLDTSIGASARLFSLDPQRATPALLIDFGTGSTDIAVFNRGLLVIGTVDFGGDFITQTISRKLDISANEALVLKSRYGLAQSPVQRHVATAVEPSLEMLRKEIRRVIRYYEQRYPKEQPIGQIVTMGGGANMPGLTEYLTDHLRLPTRAFDPAPFIDFGHLKHFYNADRASYVTAAGLALTNPAEIFV